MKKEQIFIVLGEWILNFTKKRYNGKFRLENRD